MASAPDTQSHPRFDRVSWTVLGSLLVLAVLAGVWHVSGWVATWVSALLFPPAAGLPALWPPLRVWPLGETTVTVWLIDLVGVAVMLLTAWVQLRAAGRKHPHPGRWRAFGRGLWTTILAMVAGNLVRGIAQSFLLHSDLGTYAGQLLANVLVSALTGLVAGVVVGLVAMLLAGPKPVETYAPAEVDALFRA
ncbi:hypothetical protein L2X99_15900 [Microbacterium sp. KUDC0406]|uniref:hypothetical protein n=1 Tax=Microbacterium sp. KUDC0406 TaxID=2909588 RepID=UPI001F48C3BF|nr:hypothetical protein [Microbacterium sp. KUDC0406]UJP09840.1 hypothetical protein L2X99_15900 [Microbacterium sp. KUDC0406]